ncbi:universal stress protein UspA [Ligilactobacillus salitolerans]|uniref:Universal stress protein UspA n=1 Tax=Ligilactobacillus salitolerans TaxID=1808352 RepID=A0A401ITG0_9LACO|nr:universal stress protein [Ligilactobacillus salitolerans]GBG94830.1 universal stress protein UspA [Ligilactobacillus salitolerans]
MSVYQKIMVGIDGSSPSKRAFEIGSQLAKALSAKLYLVSVVNRDAGMDSSFGVNQDFYNDMAQTAAKQLQDYVAQAKELGLEVEAAAPVGNAKTVLAKDYPLEHKIDLIILGNTGLNGLRDIMVGSHSSYVIRRSDSDVLIVK